MTFKQIEINLGQTWQDNISPLNPSSWLLFIKIQRASCISRSWIISAANSLLSQPPSPCLAWTLSVQVEECLHFILKIFSSKGIISLNVSLLDPPELIHLHLSEMPLYSPVFYLCDRVFTLTLLLHDRDYYHQASLESIKQESPFVAVIIRIDYLSLFPLRRNRLVCSDVLLPVINLETFITNQHRHQPDNHQ